MESRPLIKPLTKPSQPVMPDEKLLSRERAAKEAAAKAAAEAERAAKAAEIEAQKKEEAAAKERLEKSMERPQRTEPVSYTHLDVYKRQDSAWAAAK